MAQDFRNTYFADSQVYVKQDAAGVIRMWDPRTNTFGAYNSDGSTRTFYKPDPKIHGHPTNLDYWSEQPGDDPRKPPPGAATGGGGGGGGGGGASECPDHIGSTDPCLCTTA